MVDGLADAFKDQHHVLVKQPVRHGPEHNEQFSMNNRQVLFASMHESYSLSRNLEVKFKYMHTIGEGGFGDRVGLYKPPRTQLHQHLAFVWIDKRDGLAVFHKSVLPGQEGDYQLQYLQGDNTVVGISPTFQMVMDIATQIGVQMNPSGGTEDKENNFEIKDTLAEDTQNLAVRDEKTQITELSYWKDLCEELSENNTRLKVKEDSLDKLMEKDEDEKVKLFTENAEILVKLENLGKHCNDAVRSKDLAVDELRTLIQQEDRFRQKLAELREENGNVEAELMAVKQEMVQIKQKSNNGDFKNFEDKMKGLLTNLDVHQRFLREANEYVVELEENKMELIEENTKMKLKLKEMQIIQRSMKKAVEMLEMDKIAFENRLNSNKAECHEDFDKSFSVEEQVEVLNEELMEKLRKVSEEKPQKKIRCDSQAVDKFPETYQLSVSAEQTPSLNIEAETVHVENGNTTSGDPQPNLPQDLHDQCQSTVASLFKDFIPPPLVCPIQSSSSPAAVIPLPPPSPLTSSSAIFYLECPLCDVSYPDNQVTELVIHVEQHMNNMPECPVCNMMFDKKDQELFQDHVQFHFQPQVIPLSFVI